MLTWSQVGKETNETNSVKIMTPKSKGKHMENFSNAITGAYDTRGPNHNPSTPYRVTVNTRSESIELVKNLDGEGVELSMKIENSDSHLPITKSQLVKYLKSCRWFNYYSEMTIEVRFSTVFNQHKGLVRFNNEGWG